MESIGAKLAALNATLNGLSALCILLGYRAVQKGNRLLHKKFMLGATALSGLFLTSYLIRFYLTGTHRYSGSGILKTLYLTILTSHTILAASVPFLVGFSIYYGMKNRLESHRKIVRFSFPIWLYVSITGVVVYLMLYHG